jgi:hypothetical protein
VNDVRYDVIQKTNNVDSTTPAMSFYKGNVGIGTTNPNAELQVTCSSTATNPDTPGTIISLYVHNPTNSASQNSVIYNRIGGTSAGKVIYAFNVLSSYGCSLVINGNDTTDRLLRFNNSSDATGTDLMVINNTNGNVSIGNTTTGTHRLNVTGSVNVSGGYLVGGVALKPATAVLADTATVLATSRNIAGVGFNGSGAIDIPYFNLTNKITAGTGISLTTGSASSSPTISTNLTAGTNVTFSGTAPNITINAAGGAASQWITTGNNIYYNTGNVGIGTNNPTQILQVGSGGRLKIANSSSDFTIIGTSDVDATTNTRIALIGNTYGGGISGILNYYATSTTGYHAFHTTDSNTERMRIASNGNIGIGTTSPFTILDIYKSTYTGALLCLDAGEEGDTSGTKLPRGIGKPLIKLGKKAWTNVGGSGDYYGIGFGFSPLLTDFNCAEIGTLITSTSGNETGDLVFSTRPNTTNVAATERMRIASNGNIGIGTNNPGFRLEVSGYTSAGTFNGYYLGGSGVSTWPGPWNVTVAKFNGDVWTTAAFFSSSDIRIKEDIQDIIDDIALQSILSIEPKTYKYVDKLQKGDKKVYGFIAQQIKDVIPEAVVIEKSYIPNIYLVADYNSNVITLSSQPTKVVIKVDDKIKCYDNDNKDILVEVIEVIDDLTFRIKDIEYSDTKIFVYGTFVDDFHTLNKDYIFTLNVCATQELHRRIEAQSLLIKSQNDRIKDLETKMERMLSGAT